VKTSFILRTLSKQQTALSHYIAIITLFKYKSNIDELYGKFVYLFSAINDVQCIYQLSKVLKTKDKWVRTPNKTLPVSIAMHDYIDNNFSLF